MARLNVTDVTEQKRLNDAREAGMPWKKWDPYLSERQWETVREDQFPSVLLQPLGHLSRTNGVNSLQLSLIAGTRVL